MSVFINPCAPLAGTPLLAEGRVWLRLSWLPTNAQPQRAPPVGPRLWREALTAAPVGCGPRGRGGAAGPRSAAGAFCSAPADPLCVRGGSFLPGSAPRRCRCGLSHRTASWLASGRCPPSRGRAARVPSPSARGDPGRALGSPFREARGEQETPRGQRAAPGLPSPAASPVTRSPGSGSAEPGCGLSSSEALNTKVGREPPRGAAVPPHYACMEKQTNKNISNAPPARRAPAPRARSLPAFSFLHSFALCSAPFPGFSRCYWSCLLLLKLFFFPRSRWSGVAEWGRAGRLVGSSHSGIQGLKGRA